MSAGSDLQTVGPATENAIRTNSVRTRGTLRLRNDLYCVEWGVKFYSLTHSRAGRTAAERRQSASDWLAKQTVSMSWRFG